jgi:NAD(P)-dependent dehydrogenase (short-subunit alcohol dehydrogenase family)
MPTGEIAGKVAIVTGGGRGIGRAMALGLAAAGADVVITAARNPAEIESVASEAGRLGNGRVAPLVADVASETDCRRTIEEAIRLFGAIHILVNNAARGMRFVSESFLEKPVPFWQADSEAWRMIVDANVNGPFLMARAAAPHLIARRWGRIVNVSINLETMKRAGFSPYGPSKAALESETVIWAKDLEGTGVTVNALLPGGATATGMVPERISPEIRRGLLDPAIMVAPLIWLVSERSDGFTGGRYVASRWDTRLPPAQAAERSREPAGWR